MAYQFNNQILSKVNITDEQSNDFTLQGINARETDANVIMSGLSSILGIVGWSVTDAVRVVNQDIVETE